MLRAVDVVLVLLSPTLLFGALLQGRRLLRSAAVRRHTRRAAPAPVSLEQLAHDARRLRRELRDVEDRPDGRPGRGTRVAALRSAYADCLGDAARLLEVPPQEFAAPVYRLEAALRQRGLEVATGGG